MTKVAPGRNTAQSSYLFWRRVKGKTIGLFDYLDLGAIDGFCLREQTAAALEKFQIS